MTDTPTTHKEMTLPESVTLYKVDIPNVGTMLTFAEPINPDCTFIMGEYTRHPKPMVQVEGVSNQRALNYVIHAEELIGNYTGNDRDVINAHGLIGNARAELEAKLTKTAENINLPAEVNAALKNPSDAGGE